MMSFLAAGATALTFGSLVAQEIPTIRVPVRLVLFPTLVFSGEGRLISGLQSSSFRAFDNGSLQKVTVDNTVRPMSIAFAIQINQDVREYLPFVAKTGSIIDSLVLGESGEAAVLTYSDDVTVIKYFDDAGGVEANLKTLYLFTGLTDL
jgi:hypothetical protein